MCDKLTADGGHVEEQIMSDITLRQSIEQEGGSFIQFLTNRYKIVALTCVDTFNGKQKEISLRPQMKKKKMTNIVTGWYVGRQIDVINVNKLMPSMCELMLFGPF